MYLKLWKMFSRDIEFEEFSFIGINLHRSGSFVFKG